MSGTPVKNAMLATLAKLGVESLGPELAGRTVEEQAEAYLLEYSANAGNLSKLARSLHVSPSMVYTFLRDPERKRRLSLARELSSHILIDDAEQSLADALTPQEASIASSRAKFAQWLASVRNRGDYGGKVELQHSISVDGAYLEALQAAQSQRISSLPKLALMPVEIDTESE